MRILLIIEIIMLLGCSSGDLRLVREDSSEQPLRGLSAEERGSFDRGDTLFEQTWRASQGLGPVYIRASCASCHEGDAKGPGGVERVVLVSRDGVTALEDQSALPWGSVLRPLFTAGAMQGINAPSETENALRTLRLGPAVFGRGWIEAVDERELSRVAAEQRASGGPEQGVVPLLSDGRIGRFGVKSRVATLEEFTADAFQGDLGLTSPLRSDELPNPDNLHDDDRAGVDLSLDVVRDTASYVRLLAIPARTGLTAAGLRTFQQARCGVCHTPALATRNDYSVRAIAGVPAELYSDLLLHNLGDSLADGVREGRATERHWRTAPLVGLRFLRGYLHDGRAHTLEEAVRLHRGPGSEGNASIDAFDALEPSAREALLDFLRRL